MLRIYHKFEFEARCALVAFGGDKNAILCNLQIRKGEENERISGGSSEGRLKCKRTAGGLGRQRVYANPPPTRCLPKNFENPAMRVWFVRKCFASKQIQNADDQLSNFVRNDKVVTLLTNRRTLVIKADLLRCSTIKPGLVRNCFMRTDSKH